MSVEEWELGLSRLVVYGQHCDGRRREHGRLPRVLPPDALPAGGRALRDPAELERVWGERWGSVDEVGALRSVLMRRPGPELEQIRADAWNPAAQALVDPNGGWYWESEDPPDLPLVARQHGGLVAALEAEDVRVYFAEPLEERFTKAIYTRDPLISVPGGVIVGRLAPLMRRGEERSVTRSVGALGVPILRTITGQAARRRLVCKLTPRVAAFGTSIRCNDEAASQLAETLRLGIDLIVVPMSGYSIHLDGHFAMVDVDKALVDPTGLPHWFLDKLAELGIESIWCHPEEGWAINSLAVRPACSHVRGPSPYGGAAGRRGVEVVALPYDEIQKNEAGSIAPRWSFDAIPPDEPGAGQVQAQRTCTNARLARTDRGEDALSARTLAPARTADLRLRCTRREGAGMYARIARFEGLDTSRIDEQVAEMKRQIDEGRASGDLPAGAPEQVRTLMQTVKRLLQLVDRESGTALGITFCATEEDMRRVDAALNEMSPGEGQGRRAGVEIYEVALDETLA